MIIPGFKNECNMCRAAYGVWMLDEHDILCKCSCCGGVFVNPTNYCPDCGALMLNQDVTKEVMKKRIEKFVAEEREND